jgi:hypothetical protein
VVLSAISLLLPFIESFIVIATIAAEIMILPSLVPSRLMTSVPGPISTGAVVALTVPPPVMVIILPKCRHRKDNCNGKCKRYKRSLHLIDSSLISLMDPMVIAWNPWRSKWGKLSQTILPHSWQIASQKAAD